MRWVILFALGACVPVDDGGEIADGELALYRVDAGESIGFVADKLQFPGGYKALKRALGKQSDELRAHEGLVIPIEYTRALGLDPYLDLGLEPYEAPLPDAPLTPCRTSEDHGVCVDLGDRSICIEETAPRAVTGDPEIEPEYDCTWQADGATDCPRVTGRELVLYRDTQRRVISPLPSGGRWHHGDLTLETHLVDLDGDRADELIAIVPIDVYSRGGIVTHRVFVIDGRNGSRVTQLDVDQWGEGSIVANDRATCDLFVTNWEDGELDPRLPSGWYLVGRPFEYERGELLPRGERRVRRLRETAFHIEDNEIAFARPAAWLTAPGSSRWRQLPARGELRPGRLIGIATKPSAGLVLDIAFPDGSTVHLDPEREGGERLRALGWAPTASPLPEMYVPADPARWIDAQVLVDVPVEDDAYDIGREVWIAP